MITLPGIDQTLIFRYPVPYGSEPCVTDVLSLSLSLFLFSLTPLSELHETSIGMVRYPVRSREREREREGLPCTIPSLTHQGYKSSYAIIGCN